MLRFRKEMAISGLVLLLIGLSGCGSVHQEVSSQKIKTDLTALPKKAVNHQPKKQASSNPSSNENASKPAQIQKENMKAVTAVRLADPQSGWVGGKGWIARTNDGGKDWNVQYRGKGTVHQLFALNHQQVWATLETDPNQANPFKLIKSLDGGKHWETAGIVPNDAFLHFVSKDEAFSANAETFNGGKTWRNLPIPNNTVGNAYFHDQNNGWVVTKGTNTFHVERTTDAGKTWHIVMTRKTTAPLTGVIIRSAGSDDAWVECIGDSGMSQTSYSLFHTTDGGKNWKTVIANSTAGGGPAPGFPMNDYGGPHNAGSAPGPLYVVNSNVAFMAGKCPACNESNSIGWTKDGGKTWVNGKAKFKGYGQELLAIADAKQGWWITTNNQDQKTSTMYTTSDGGEHWTKVHVFQ